MYRLSFCLGVSIRLWHFAFIFGFLSGFIISTRFPPTILLPAQTAGYPQERADVLGGVLIVGLLRQEGEADTLGISPPQQVNDDKIKHSQPFAQGQKNQKAVPKLFKSRIFFNANPKTENTTVKRSKLPSRIAMMDFSCGAAFPSTGCSRTAFWTAS